MASASLLAAQRAQESDSGRVDFRGLGFRV